MFWSYDTVLDNVLVWGNTLVWNLQPLVDLNIGLSK